MGLLTKEMIKPAKKNWQYFLGIFVLSALSLPLVYNGGFSDPIIVARALIWSYCIWLSQFVGHTYIIANLDRKIGWMERPLLRAGLGIFAMVIYASGAFIAVNFFMYAIFFQSTPPGELSDWVSNSWFAIKVSFAVSFIITSIGFFNAWRTSEIEKERINTQMMTHKYNALRNQINPHFLFNSLNVLSELVYEDQDEAVKFIRQLSDLYRYVLSSKTEDLVPLSKEIEFIDSYIFLLKTRFSDNLNIQVNVKSKDDEYIVPMSIQMLLENAVKHNEVSRKKPLRITVERAEGYVKVSNNLQAKKVVEESTRAGIQNIRQRYSYLSNKEIRIEPTAAEYKVFIPILNVEKE